MKDCIALILAGGRVDAMGVLTARRSMAAVPFGGMYRIIDFVLTNLVDSGVPHAGILCQYKPASLMDHVGIGRPWDFNGRTRELTFLPPFEGTKELDWYRGTAHAIHANLHVIERYKPRDVLVLSGDHAYRMDYGALVDQHRRSNADLTMAFKRLDTGRPSRFGVGVLGEGSRVLEYQEKPADPKSDLASMTVYCFRTDVLVRAVQQNALTGRTFQLYDEVIPGLVADGRVFGHVFEGGWEYLRPLAAWHDAHMRMLSTKGIPVPVDTLLTNLEAQGVAEAPPVHVGASGEARRSIIGPGGRIQGRVLDSVLFPACVVEEGALVEESVLLNGVTVRRGAVVRRAVLDKGVVVGADAVLDGGDALVSVGKAARVGDGSRVPAGTELAPGTVWGEEAP